MTRYGAPAREAAGVAEWQAGHLATATHAHQADGLGRDGNPGQSRLQSERDQNAAGIGRELHAGARFLKPLSFLQDYYSEAFRRERERGRQPPDSGAGDEDGARRRHRTTRSGGLILDDAFGRAGLARLQVGRETKQGRAVRTDDLVIVA